MAPRPFPDPFTLEWLIEVAKMHRSHGLRLLIPFEGELVRKWLEELGLMTVTQV